MRAIASGVILAGLVLAAPSRAAELKILSAGAFKPVVTALVPGFEAETKHKVTVDNDTAGALAKRIAGGESFDLVVLTPEAISQLIQAGKVTGPAPTRLARVAIGVAVKAGAPLPHINSEASFKATLLAAKSVAYIDPAAGGSSGVYLAKLFETWGIADQIKAKAVLVPGGLVAERVVNGTAEIAIHQISEILAVPGATLVGPIPAGIQNYTVYAGGVATAARDAKAAQDFLALLTGPKAQAVLKDKGMEPAPAS